MLLDVWCGVCVCVSGFAWMCSELEGETIAAAHQSPIRSISYLHYRHMNKMLEKRRRREKKNNNKNIRASSRAFSVRPSKAYNDSSCEKNPRTALFGSTQQYKFFFLHHIESNWKTGVTMEPFGSVVWLTVPMPCHTTHSRPKTNRKNRYNCAPKFPRYIMLQSNSECTFAACPRLSGDATNGKEKKGRFRVGPTKSRKIQMHAKWYEIRELWSIHLYFTLTATETTTFGHFLIFSWCSLAIVAKASVTTSSVYLYLFSSCAHSARSAEKLVICVYLCWCRESATRQATTKSKWFLHRCVFRLSRWTTKLTVTRFCGNKRQQQQQYSRTRHTSFAKPFFYYYLLDSRSALRRLPTRTILVANRFIYF